MQQPDYFCGLHNYQEEVLLGNTQNNCETEANWPLFL